LHHVCFLNDASYFDILNNFFFQKYYNDDGVGKLSMTSGAEKHDHWGLIYSGGFFVGISQDMIIRKATNNEKSIDDLMRYLFTKYGGTNDSYSLNDLQKYMSELSGIDQTEFFKTYVTGVNRIPIDNYLSMAGLNAKIEDGQLIINQKDNANSLQLGMVNGLFGILPKK